MKKSIKGRQRICAGLSILATIILTAGHAGGEDKPQVSNTDLAKTVQNPVANMISLPFQNNTDFGIGPQDQTRNTLNIQPVVPFKLTSDWMLITRTIAPVLAQPHTFANSGSVVPLDAGQWRGAWFGRYQYDIISWSGSPQQDHLECRAYSVVSNCDE